jgi:hypothetical protein
MLSRNATNNGNIAEKVFAGTRDVLWCLRHFSLWINKIKHFFGTSLITLLSDLLFWGARRESLSYWEVSTECKLAKLSH